MPRNMNRRAFLRTSLLASFAAATIPFSSRGQIVEGIGLLYAIPEALEGIGDILEGGYFIVSGIVQSKSQSDKLSVISNKLSQYASSQDAILKQLADQRLVMSEELQKAFMNNDARELRAVAEHFKIALLDKQETSSLGDIAGRVDELTTKLATYGLAGAPAYITAITLQNAVHYKLGSEPSVFQAINEPHITNIDGMLNGQGDNSLFKFASSIYDPTTYLKAFNYPVNDDNLFLLNTGRRYPLAIIDEVYEPDSSNKMPHRQFSFGYEYQGYKEGKPLFVPYREPITNGVYIIDENESGDDQAIGWGTSISLEDRPAPTSSSVLKAIYFNGNMNGALADDYKQIPELRKLSNTFKMDGYYGFKTQKAPDGVHYLIPDAVKGILSEQLQAVQNYYAALINGNSSFTKDAAIRALITKDPGCITMSDLLNGGLKGTKRIITLAQAGARPTLNIPASLQATNSFN